MANVVTGSTSAFGGDPLWAENKQDSIAGLSVADLPTRSIALYANETDKQFKFINQYMNAELAAPHTLATSGTFGHITASHTLATSGTFGHITASHLDLNGAGPGGTVSADYKLAIGGGSDNHGIVLHPSNTGLGDFTVGRNGVTRGRLRYSNNSDQWLIGVQGIDTLQLSTTALYGSSDGAVDLGQVDQRYNNAYILNTGSFGHVTASTLHLAGAEAGDEIAEGEELVIGDGTGDAGITIFVDPASAGGIFVTDNGSNRGAWEYFDSSGRWRMSNSGIARWYFDADEIVPSVAGFGNLGNSSLPIGTGSMQVVYLAGAEESDGYVDATDLVIGDGTTNNGISLFTSNTGTGEIAFIDTAGGAGRGGIAYRHTVGDITFRTEGTNRLHIEGGAMRPGTTSYDLGELGNEFDTLYVQTGTMQVAHLAGAAAGDAASNANNLIIGDGNSDVGMTINHGSNTARINFKDASNDADWSFRYNGGSMTVRTNNVDSYLWSGLEFRPVGGVSLDLGGEEDNEHWQNLYVQTGSFSGPCSGVWYSYHDFFNNSGDGDECFIPWYGASESPSAGTSTSQFPVPAAGRLKKLQVASTNGTGTEQTFAFGLYASDGFSGSPTLVGQATASFVRSNQNSPITVVDLDEIVTGSNHFSAGQFIALSISGGIDNANYGSIWINRTYVYNYTTL